MKGHRFEVHDSKELGKLIPIEFSNLIFNPVRCFSITDSKIGTLRGNHAHLRCNQLLLCLKGRILVKKIGSSGESEVILNPGESTTLEKMVWSSQEFMTGEDVLLVFCDSEYDRKEYLEDKIEFLKLIENRSYE